MRRARLFGRAEEVRQPVGVFRRLPFPRPHPRRARTRARHARPTPFVLPPAPLPSQRASRHAMATTQGAFAHAAPPPRASAPPRLHRASRHRPTPRLLADAEAPPTAPTSAGVRQTTLNATRSSNFVRFMLACVPSRASSTRARARGKPLVRRDPPSFPRAQLCARARVRAPRAISARAPTDRRSLREPRFVSVLPSTRRPQRRASQDRVQARRVPARLVRAERPLRGRRGASGERRPRRAAAA